MSAPRLFDNSPHPGEILREKLAERGWTYDELAVITGKSTRAIGEIARGRAGVTPEMALAFAAAFGNTAEEWLRWDSLYRLSNARRESDEFGNVQRKAKLYEIAPIRDMQKRGWIRQTDSLDELEGDLKKFFETDSVDTAPTFSVAFKKTSPLVGCNAAERAWCFRAKQLAALLVVNEFKSSQVKNLKKDLRVLAAFTKEAVDIAKIMAEYGIRFVVVEPIQGAKIDGAAFWLDERSPVIAVSLRYDRNDSVWFTVMHEVEHVANSDVISVDTDLVADPLNPESTPEQPLILDESEQRANEGAADALIPRSEIESFIRRVGPLYSKQRIIQFSHRMKIHPGIVVGQLQKRKEIGYFANREMFSKIRAVVTDTALTDGWGRFVESVR